MVSPNNRFLLLIITLSIFIFYPLTFLKANPAHFHPENEIKDEMKMDHDHHHNLLDISNLTNIPSVEIHAHPDNVKGWNLEIKTTNFTFTPENLGKGSNPNQGHAHLYVNGKKIGRIYSSWHYLSELPPGENEIKVTLNTDDHQALVYQGQIIGDRVIINNK